MAEAKKIKFSETEKQSLKGKETGVYLASVMQKVFRTDWEKHLKCLLTGDRDTLDTCAKHLARNLDLFPLLHTLCLVTDRRYDLEVKDPVKAADRWVTWYSENEASLVWDGDREVWILPRPE